MAKRLQVREEILAKRFSDHVRASMSGLQAGDSFVDQGTVCCLVLPGSPLVAAVAACHRLRQETLVSLVPYDGGLGFVRLGRLLRTRSQKNNWRKPTIWAEQKAQIQERVRIHIGAVPTGVTVH